MFTSLSFETPHFTPFKMKSLDVPDKANCVFLSFTNSLKPFLKLYKSSLKIVKCFAAKHNFSLCLRTGFNPLDFDRFRSDTGIEIITCVRRYPAWCRPVWRPGCTIPGASRTALMKTRCWAFYPSRWGLILPYRFTTQLYLRLGSST